MRETPDLRLQLIKLRIEDTIRQCFIAFRFFISPYYSGVTVSLSSAQEKTLGGGAAGPAGTLRFPGAWVPLPPL